MMDTTIGNQVLAELCETCRNKLEQSLTEKDIKAFKDTTLKDGLSLRQKARLAISLQKLMRKVHSTLCEGCLQKLLTAGGSI